MSYENINNYLSILASNNNEEENTVIAIELANEVLKIFGVPQNELKYGEDVLNEAFPSRKFKHQKMESWFAKHPYMSSARVALTHFQGLKIPVETKFYRLSDSANKAKISATTQIDSNWEDSNLTMRPQYKVGIDFFLNAEGTALLIVLTNKGNLRVLELNEKLSKTQIEIFEKVKGCFLFDGINPKSGLVEEFEPQRTIHKNLWNSFALQEVNKKFYLGIAEHFEELVQHIHRNIPENVSEMTVKNDAKLFATRLLGRLLFLWFLKKRNVINEKFHYFSVEDENSTDYYENKLKKLFFNVLNTPNKERIHQDLETPYLNGGLFDAHPNDWADKMVSFPTNWFASLYEHFNSFNFTTDESSPDYEQIAIDPEMLGRVFENLLATIVPETSQAASEKKNKGAFYTPREIVDYMSKESLKRYLKQYQNNTKDEDGIDKLIDMNDADFLVLKSTGSLDLWGSRSQEVKTNLIQALNKMKVLDPACGSGAFPMGLLQLIVRTYERLSAYYDKNLRIHRPIRPNEKNDTYETKLAIIQNNLFGSDIEPMAIEISRLRSWLSLVIDDKGEIEPLPNLDFNFVCANSLIPLDKPTQINIFENLEFEMEIEKLIDEYFQIHEKKSKLLLKTKFASLYDKNLANSAETRRVQQLRSWNPFEADKPAGFFDSKIMFNVEKFNLVIGNPPYIHFEDIKDISKKIYAPIKYSTYTARGDIYTLFYELGINNLSENGHLCFITSNKWMRAGYGELLRDYFVKNTQPLLLIDLGSGVFESATVDTNILVLQKSSYIQKTSAVSLKPESRLNGFNDFVKTNSVQITFQVGQLWTILNPLEQSIKAKVEKYGLTLKDWPDLRINFGIKTGLNEVLIVDDEKRQEILSNCKTEEERKKTEMLIQPVLRGRDIKQNSFEWAGLFVILAVYGSHKWIPNENPALYQYLLKYKEQLEKRGQCRYLSNGKTNDLNSRNYPGYLGMHHWLELDNNPSEVYITSFRKPKIIYSEIVRKPQFYLDNNGLMIDASAFFLTGFNLGYLVQALNSNIVALIFKKFYAGGGLGNDGFRYKKVFLENLPIPFIKDEDILVNDDLIAELYKFSFEEINYLKNALDQNTND